MGIILKISRIILNILSYFAYVLIAVYAAIEIPMLFGHIPLVVLSGSMEPTYPVGCILYYKSTPESELKEGDVITFKLSDNTTVSHRINSISDADEYITKGDANNTVDSKPVSYSNVLGKVDSFKIKYLGYFVKFINEHTYVIGIVAGVLILDFIVSNIDIPKKDKKKTSKRVEESEKNTDK